jgi:hypothetical protein
VEKVVHSPRRGTQIYNIYDDGDEVVLSAKECDELMDTIIEWPENFSDVALGRDTHNTGEGLSAELCI